MKTTAIRAAKTAGFLLLTTFAATPLMAQTATDYSAGWYLGGNVGQSKANIDKERIILNLASPVYSDDDNDLGYKLFGGYQFNQYFAIEGGYFDLGEVGYSLSTPTGSLDAKFKARGLNVDLVGTLPITERFSAFARAGAIYAQTEVNFKPMGSLTVVDTNPKENEFQYKFGLGMQYAISDALGVRIEAERYRLNDTVGNMGDVDLYSIGLVYRFGVAKKVAPYSDQRDVGLSSNQDEPIIVTAPDASEKIQKAVEQKKVVVLVFEDIHFKFDDSTLSKEAQGALKKAILKLQDNPKIKMQVAGHTSKIGAAEYNQELSVRRAQSVKDYLVQEGLISANRISIVGYGETRPAQYEANPKNVYSKPAKANMRVILEIIHQ